MRLHGSPTSPYVRKVRVALDEAGASCEFAVCNVWQSDSYIPDLNPLGKVPVLETAEGEVLYDSFVIIAHLDRKHDTFLIPPDADDRLRVLRWHALAHGIVDAAVAQVIERRRPPQLQSPDYIGRESGRIFRALGAADNAIESDGFLCGNRMTLADITLAVALQYLDFRIRRDWRQDCPTLAGWLDAIGVRPSLANTLPQN